MLSVAEDLRVALGSSQSGVTRGLVSYQGVSTALGLEQSGSVSVNGSAAVQAAGSVTVVGAGVESLVPSRLTDALAPFGQELTLWRELQFGREPDLYVQTVPLGVFRLTSASDSSQRFRGSSVVDWSVKVSFSDRLKMLVDDDFLVPEGPVSGASVWDEVRRLSPFPVQESLGDVAVPAGTVYRSRVDAVTVLLGLLGGVPHVTRQGALTARLADRWLTETVPDAVILGVIRLSLTMDDRFFNQVAVENPTDPLITATASILDDSNPLSVKRAGGRTYRHSSPVYATRAQAQAGADTILSRVSTQRVRTAEVLCTPEALLLEVGDVALFQDADQRVQVLAEVSGMRIPLDPTQPVSLSVIIADVSTFEPEPELDLSGLGLYGLGSYGLGLYGVGA